MAADSKNALRGFTLVELLVVIAIIAMLIALLLPAVQSSRESARLLQCRNNLQQMTKGCLAHEEAQGFLPTGGWGWMWAGDPDRGYGQDQPGGWHYNILPFIDQVLLHDGGASTPIANREAAGLIRNESPVAIFICPTRHKVQAYPRQHPVHYLNISDPMPRVIGRSDYAANSGSNFSNDDPGNAGQPGQPGTSGVGPDGIYPVTVDWSKYAGTLNSPLGSDTGVIFRASVLQLASIKDGASNTYLIGERYLCPDAYQTGTNCDNDQGWDLGYDYDTNRWTGIGYEQPSDLSSSNTKTIVPMQDQPGACGCMMNFGSSHFAGFNMTFCDGSARLIRYSIDPIVHMQLSNRADGAGLQTQAY